MNTYGTIERSGDKTRVRFERRLSHPVDGVWRAITDRNELRQWFPQDVDLVLEPGAKLRFEFREEDKPDPADVPGLEEIPDFFDGEVLEVDPHHRLSYTWGTDVLTFELTPDGDGTRLVLTATFEPDEVKEPRDAAGWHVCLDALGAHVEGGPAPAKDAWQPIYEEYVERFKPA
jgi:uncharacterized protein YndB with AHSA1/START domain